MASVVAEARERAARRAQDQRADCEVGGIEAAISAVQRDPSINDLTLEERLLKRVGLGDNAAKRRALYARLSALHRAQPDLVERLISEAWACSIGARRRDRYFCKAITAKLAEAHLGARENGGADDDSI